MKGRAFSSFSLVVSGAFSLPPHRSRNILDPAHIYQPRDIGYSWQLPGIATASLSPPPFPGFSAPITSNSRDSDAVTQRGRRPLSARISPLQEWLCCDCILSCCTQVFQSVCSCTVLYAHLPAALELELGLGALSARERPCTVRR